MLYGEWTHTEPSTNNCLLIDEDDLADTNRPGCHDTWQLGIELDDDPELAVDHALWRGMTNGAMQCTILVHAAADDDHDDVWENT